MLLAVDIGNSHTVLGLFGLTDDDTIAADPVERWRISTGRTRTADEVFLLIGGLMRGAGVAAGAVGGMILSSVVPPVTPVWIEMGRRRLGCEPLVVGAGIKTGMPIKVEQPREVGADRIVNAVAAYALTGGQTIVVDLGTAITFDVVDAKGAYLGGAIAPGLGLGLDALFSRTAKLPRVDLVSPGAVIGRNTVESIQSGVFYGAVAMVDGMVARITRELGDGPCAVVATGGFAELIAKASTSVDRVEPDLTLAGLRLLYERNRR